MRFKRSFSLVCLLLLTLTPMSGVQALNTERELTGIGMEKGWVLAEGEGVGGNAETRRVKAFQQALDTYVTNRLLFSESEKNRYRLIRDTFLQTYAAFLVLTDTQQVQYQVLEKGRNAQQEEFTRLQVMLQRNAVVAFLEAQGVLEPLAERLKKLDNPRILFLPERWQDIFSSDAQKALLRFEGMLNQRGLRLISSQELVKIFEQDQALRNLVQKKANTSALQTTELMSRTSADILVLYQLSTRETERTETTVFYRSELNMRVLEPGAGREKERWQYQSGEWGLDLEDEETLKDATILEVVHPAADQIETFLRQQWAEIKRERLFSIELSPGRTQDFAQVRRVLGGSCRLEKIVKKRIDWQCPWTQAEMIQTLSLEPAWNLKSLQPLVLEFSP
jgi:hypothetical protein